MDEPISVPVTLELQITALTGLHIGTGLGRGQILDDTVVIGPHPLVPEAAPLPYIPGSSLKGRLRHTLRQLFPSLGHSAGDRLPAVEARLFGFADQPGGLLYGDAHLADPGLARRLSNPAVARRASRGERSFVALSPRRVAFDERLFRLELAAADLVFAARLSGVLPSKTVRSDLALLLLAALDLTHLGGHKGRGLGACRISLPANGITIAGDQMDASSLLEAA